MADSMPDHVCRVLIVDDEVHVRATLRRLLVRDGHEIHEAVNGRDALDQLQAGLRTCVILLDLRMPVLDGAGFLLARGATPVLAAIPVLVVSATVETAPPELPRLVKPFGVEGLREALRPLLHARTGG